jgi:hypothetical protein
MWLLNEPNGTAVRVWDSDGHKAVLPRQAVTHVAVLERVKELNKAQTIQLRLLTPLRLVADGHLVRQFSLDSLVRRTLRRLSDLQTELGGAPPNLPYERIIEGVVETKILHN